MTLAPCGGPQRKDLELSRKGHSSGVLGAHSGSAHDKATMKPPALPPPPHKPDEANLHQGQSPAKICRADTCTSEPGCHQDRVTHRLVNTDKTFCFKPLNFEVLCYKQELTDTSSVPSRTPLRILRNLAFKKKGHRFQST